MANVAIIQGSSRNIGLYLARHLLQNTSMSVVATSRDASLARRSILSSDSGPAVKEDRLMTLGVDVRDEAAVEKAAKDVRDRFGGGCLRLLINVSGVLHPEKSIDKIDLQELKRTFEINTFGHLLMFKHFIPLLPSKKDARAGKEADDPAHGVVKPGLSVLASLSARVGSIGDNNKGGWYSYRSSKAALNQSIKTLSLELSHRSVPAIAVALHPGTVVGTDLSRDFTRPEDVGKKKGVHGPDEAAKHLIRVIGGLGEEDGGKFLDWEGKGIEW